MMGLRCSRVICNVSLQPVIKLSAPVAAVAISVAAVLLPLQANALTTDWDGSYTTQSSGVLSFKMKGDLQTDNNTIFINSFSDVSLNGSSPIDLPFAFSVFELITSTSTPATTTIDGTYQDFAACSDSNCLDLGFLIGGAFTIGVDIYIGSPVLAPTGAELYDPTKWSLKAASTSTSVPGPLPIFGVASVFYFSRKLRKRIKASKSEKE